MWSRGSNSMQCDIRHNNSSRSTRLFKFSRKTKMFSRMWVRRLATAAAGKGQPAGIVPSNPGYQHVQQMQNLLCRDDGLLVWQKLGSRDRFGYYFTMLVMFGGFVPALAIIYRLSFPQKRE